MWNNLVEYVYGFAEHTRWHVICPSDNERFFFFFYIVSSFHASIYSSWISNLFYASSLRNYTMKLPRSYRIHDSKWFNQERRIWFLWLGLSSLLLTFLVCTILNFKRLLKYIQFGLFTILRFTRVDVIVVSFREIKCDVKKKKILKSKTKRTVHANLQFGQISAPLRSFT